MKMMLKAALVAGFVGSMAWAPQASAAVITIAGVTASSSSDIGTPFSRPAVNTVNGSGADFTTGFTSTDPSTMWLNSGTSGEFGPADLAPSITFNLGDVYVLSSVYVLNYNETGHTNRGIATADVFMAGADGVYGVTPVATIAFTQASGDSVTDNKQFFTGASLVAQYVSLRNLTSFVGSDGYVGLSEITFEGTSVAGGTAVPEPATMALLGFGLLGAAAARKRARALV